jgi:hypothetical protein
MSGLIIDHGNGIVLENIVYWFYESKAPKPSPWTAHVGMYLKRLTFTPDGVIGANHGTWEIKQLETGIISEIFYVDNISRNAPDDLASWWWSGVLLLLALSCKYKDADEVGYIQRIANV